MKRYVEGSERRQNSLFAERLDDRIGDDDPVRAIDVFVDRLDLGELGFGRVAPRATGRPSPARTRIFGPVTDLWGLELEPNRVGRLTGIGDGHVIHTRKQLCR